MRGWTAGRLGIAAFGLACAVLLLIGWTSLRRMADLREASASVDRTLMVREAAETFLSLLKDAETAQRGFVITGDHRYLERYDAARASIPQHLKRLRHLTADNPAQQASLLALKELIQRKLDEVRDTIAAREQGGFEAAARIIASGEGRRAMDEIRAVIVAMREEEDRLLTKRHAIEERQARVATITSL